VQTTHRSDGRAHDGPTRQWPLAALLLCPTLLAVEAVTVSIRNPSSLLVPACVFAVANALLLGPALWRALGSRVTALVAAAALSSRARWSSWTVTARRRHADSVR
jgi:hypothetical protein